MKYTAFILAAALGTIRHAALAADSPAPFYQVTVVEPTIKAVNYEHLGGTTKIPLRGTVILPKAEGKAAVTNEEGTVRIKASFKGLEAPSRFQPSDLTYVLWAISPEGRAVNLGELVLHGGSSSLSATTELQTFALVVTAEPYYSVAQPGNVVVLENAVPEKSAIKSETVEVKYEFQKRGEYTSHGVPEDMAPVAMDKKVPFELYEARNAVKIAKADGADAYAPDAFKKADQSLQEAEGFQAHRHWYSKKKRQVVQASRRAIQGAEDARLIAMKRKEDEGVASRIKGAQDLAARADAEKTQALSEAEKQRLAAASSDQAKQQALAEAEKERLAAATSEGARQLALAEAEKERLAAASSDQARQQAEHDLIPDAREKLAKIAGVVLSHPGLKLTIEGHTDSVGSDEYNQKLSEMRAAEVKDYLAQAGVSVDALTAEGFGKTKPLGSNDTPEGRAKNRRVDIIVSGEAIGTPAVDASTSSVAPPAHTTPQ